ncbi:hypothetical protein CH373_07810 [Leptospira perolatii]|uniref:Uncharacterized protein n=1 Tax=Leptospira perolatii TaxID=2023191 RepID=A0A2M9ZPL6_9LEPT|nr:hypothetical protein CH373_07810 [Leptospira perolatii]
MASHAADPKFSTNISDLRKKILNQGINMMVLTGIASGILNDFCRNFDSGFWLFSSKQNVL